MLITNSNFKSEEVNKKLTGGHKGEEKKKKPHISGSEIEIEVSLCVADVRLRNRALQFLLLVQASRGWKWIQQTGIALKGSIDPLRQSLKSQSQTYFVGENRLIESWVIVMVIK